MKIRNKKNILRYGENPNQKAYILEKNKKSIFDYQISGKKLSYNNIIDADSGLKCLSEFDEPTSIIVKHTNPCGVASSNNISVAFKKSLSSDTKSAFGGIVFLNRKVNSDLAKILIKNFFEMIVASDFNKDALEILKKKKNLIILKKPITKRRIVDMKSTIFGDLYQTVDLNPINKNFLRLVSNKKASTKVLNDLVFSLKVAKHLKSNAIVLSKNKQTIGLGLGQTNRVDSLRFAIRNKNTYFKKSSFVCVSDGFFPFTDSINLLNKNGCNFIAQPFGSINDDKIIVYAKKNNISLYFIKNRLFKH
tara:strand:+ start:194 stop:1111 length:918 start_codon:yes stop_codon:yes gene_type:complete